MRSFFLFLLILLPALLLLYGGLNLAERNLAELMGLEREAAAIMIEHKHGAGLTLTFCGSTVTIDLNRMTDWLDLWRSYL